MLLSNQSKNRIANSRKSESLHSSGLSSGGRTLSKGGIIHDAVSTQEWSGDAAVHVSIVNWSKENPNRFFLDGVPVSLISSSLKQETSVLEASKLQANKNTSFESCGLRGKGFIVREEEAKSWIETNSKNKNVLKPMIDGRGLTYPFEKLDWVIDFNDMSGFVA